MIHSLMSEYGIKKGEAEQMTEYDYMLMVAFKGLDGAKEKFYYDNHKE